MAKKLPSTARVVVIGGGIMGCSVAYHLTRLGWDDVVLLEQNKLTSGTTWHAAGLVGQLRNSESLTRIASYAIDLYGRLEEETGYATGFKRNGAITVAQTTDRLIELRRHIAMAGTYGIECHLLDVNEIRRKWPLANVSDLVGGVWLPKDGQTNPTDTTLALAKGARMGGAKIFEDTAVKKIEKIDTAVSGVTTDFGNIRCEKVVACTGLWTRDFASKLGLVVPLHASEHMYIVTEPMDNVPGNLPVLRDYDSRLYFKEDAGKILVGLFEDRAKPWGTTGIPEDHAFALFNEDWDHFSPYMENAIKRLPALKNIGVRQFLNGAESFTPDNRYILGEVPGLRNFFVGAGFNSIGIASGAGAGKALAEWVVGGAMPFDLWEVDVRRFHAFEAAPNFLRDRTVELVGKMYAMHWPYDCFQTGRNVRKLPYHDHLEKAGACFAAVGGWERPMWYAQTGQKAKYNYSYSQQNWWQNASVEARAARSSVALFELTPFCKFVIQGRDAENFLQRICTSDMSGKVGNVRYTQMLNENGGIEADVTVAKVAENEFFVVTSSASGVHDADWMVRNIPSNQHVSICEVTSGFAVLGLMGPSSRDLLSQLSFADLSRTAFPFSTVQNIDVGYSVVRALRVSYVGELGYELYIPTEQAQGVFEIICEEGKKFGLQKAGFHAQDSLRLEKGFKHWGHDIGPGDTPLEAGLNFTCDFNKSIPFIGREVLVRQQKKGCKRRLVTMTVEEGEPLLLREEPVYRNGKIVGVTTSGAMAYTIGKPIALAWIRNTEGIGKEFLETGSYEIDVAGERYPAKIYLRPPYDSEGLRMRN